MCFAKTIGLSVPLQAVARDSPTAACELWNLGKKCREKIPCLDHLGLVSSHRQQYSIFHMDFPNSGKFPSGPTLQNKSSEPGSLPDLVSQASHRCPCFYCDGFELFLKEVVGHVVQRNLPGTLCGASVFWSTSRLKRLREEIAKDHSKMI